MYYFATIAFWIGIAGCIGFGLYLWLNAPDPWSTNESQRRIGMTIGLLASIAIVLVAGTISYGSKKSAALQYAQKYLANTYSVTINEVIMGDAVCTAPGRYSCETWVAGYVVVKGAKKLAGIVKCDPYGALDLRQQLME